MVKSIELFSGTGGLALGLQQAGFSHVALVERDARSCENLQSNINAGACEAVKGWHVFHSDVRAIDFTSYEGEVQMVSGGPPCQPFSLGGKARAHEDCRDMFPEAVRAVREIKPKAFVFENVKGLLRKSFSSYFNYILLQLEYPEIVAVPGMTWQDHLSSLERCHTSAPRQTLRYNVTFRLLNTADYGVPQKRERVVIVGFRSDVDARWNFPEGTHSEALLAYAQWVSGNYWEAHGMARPSCCPLSPVRLDAIRREAGCLFDKQRWRTVRDAWIGLSDPVEMDSEIPDHLFRGWARSYPGHSGSLMDAPSKTVKAGAHGVPGGENMICLDDGRMRYFTVREAARLQIFPDNFTFSTSWTESMRQIGNAVPVRLAQVVGESVMRHIKEV